MQVAFDTADVPAGERLDFYRDAVARGPVPLDIQGDPADDVVVRMETGQVGGILVARMTAADRSRIRVDRSARMIRRSDPGAWRMVLCTQGQTVLSQDGRHADLRRGDLGLYDTSMPFAGWRRSEEGICQLVMLTFPRALLPVPATLVGRFLGARLSGGTGLGAVVAGYLGHVLDNVDRCRPPDTQRLAGTTMDLVAALLAHEAEDERCLSAASARSALLLRAQAFIERRLGDPDLDVAAIAAATHVSPRLVQRVFQEQDVTVTGWIRARRLERCRRDLADPRREHESVHRIAARHGFPNAAHFSRLFRAVHGASPGEWRAARCAQRQGPGADEQ